MKINAGLTSMETRFHRMSFHGNKTKYKVPDFVSDSLIRPETDNIIPHDHIQGFARYTTSNGVSYDIYCRSDRNNTEHKGWLTICNKQTTLRLRTPVKEFNHPGGMQVVDNFLFVPVEKGENDKETSDIKSYICIYNLSPLDNGNPPVLVEEFQPVFLHKAGMLGVQKTVDDKGNDIWLFGIHDNTTFYLYYAKANPAFHPGADAEISPCSNELILVFSHSSKNYDFQNLNLIHYDGKLYLFGFRSVETSVVPLFDQPLSFDDYVALYEVTYSLSTDPSAKKGNIKLIAEKHFVTNTTEPGISSLDIHFRFGAGITYSAEKGLEMYATVRNRILEYFSYDTFNEVATVTTEACPSDSKRCGDNFTLNWGKGHNVEFEVFDKSSGKQIEATFCVMEDKTAATDTYQWKNVQNNETRVWMDGKKSNLYIAELKRKDEKRDAVEICIQLSDMPYVNCTKKPYEGQKERASYNFSTEHLPSNVIVQAYENYGTKYEKTSTACFIIKEDKSGTDPVLHENVSHGTTIKNIARTRSAYIAFPNGVKAQNNFTVFFEEKVSK